MDSVEKITQTIDQYYFKGEFLAWDKKQPNPTVKIVDIVGQTGDIETECRALLTEHQVYTEDFDEECAQEMQKYKEQCNEEGEYIIPEEERKKRLDLTKEIICTVDPMTARDLDDALSVNEVEDGIFEIGVHIADVSHFVEPSTRVDEEAKLRTTSVYLVHRVIPMLPRILCENLCSLNPQVERLAFSVFFYITRDGEVLWDRKPRVHKSIISSVAKLSYDIVNEMIEGKVTQIAQIEDKYKIAEGVNRAKLFDKLMLLNQLGQKRREKRLKAGSLIMETNKLRFELDEAQNPVRYQSDVRGAAQFMVEEWMLLANQFVGMELVRFNQKQAVLRKHEPPQTAKIAFFKRLLTTCNLTDMIENFNISTSDKLASILEKINARQDVSQVVKDILSFKLVKLLEAAKYFVVKDSEKFTWHHFALNFDIYTHFTSPIRRYPDILVHRLLHQTIDANAKVIRDEYLDTLMNRSNEHKLSAKRVSDGCQKIFMCLYLKKHPVTSEGMIMELNGAYLNIIVPQFNLELKRFTKDLKNITKCTVQNPEKDQQYLLIEYKDQTQPNGHRIHILEAFTKIQVQLTSTQSFPIDYQVNIIIPQRRTNENGQRVTVPYII